MMRWSLALAAIAISATLHLGMAAWFLPRDASMDIAGGEQQATIFIMGQDAFDALAAGNPELEEVNTDAEQEVVKVLTQPEITEFSDVPETVDKALEKQPKESTKDNPAKQSETPEPKIVTSSKEATDTKPDEKDQPSQQEVVAVEIDPAPSPETEDVVEETVEVETATLNIPIPTPRPETAAKPQSNAKPASANSQPASEVQPRAKETPKKKTTKKAKKRKSEAAAKPRSKPKPKTTGAESNSNTNATRGSAASGSKRNQAQGNAKASRYPGRVYAKIARTRRKQAGASGTARIRFVISANGGLSSVSLARSSGNKKVDQAALSHIRRAAPFPKPPAGAKRTFVIPLQFKN